MATRKAAPKKAPAKPTAKKPVAKEENEGRLVGSALMDPKSREFKELSERRQAWILRWADIAPYMKRVHRILEHNKGLFWIFTTDGMYQVGQMSASGKSFTVEFESEDRDESYDYYVKHRTGSYGKDKPAVAPKKAAAASKKAPAAAAKKTTRKARPKAVEVDDELEDLLD